MIIASTHLALKDRPFPADRDGVDLLRLPDGRVLPDACIWRGFLQDELGIDPNALWERLLQIPTWPDDEPIPFRPDGSDAHWISGQHRALHYRGMPIKRSKIWLQSGFEDGLRRYYYTGWVWLISPATHDVKHVPAMEHLTRTLNARLAIPHNHWIVTRYEDGSDGIGPHWDKPRDIEENSHFVVLKLGAPRRFEFRMRRERGRREPRPFYSEILPPGTAIFCRVGPDGSDAANSIVEHAVPPMDEPVGPSGSIVARCISTVVPWTKVAAEVRKRQAEAPREMDAAIRTEPTGKTAPLTSSGST